MYLKVTNMIIVASKLREKYSVKGDLEQVNLLKKEKLNRAYFIYQYF